MAHFILTLSQALTSKVAGHQLQHLNQQEALQLGNHHPLPLPKQSLPHLPARPLLYQPIRVKQVPSQIPLNLQQKLPGNQQKTISLITE